MEMYLGFVYSLVPLIILDCNNPCMSTDYNVFSDHSLLNLYRRQSINTIHSEASAVY